MSNLCGFPCKGFIEKTNQGRIYQIQYTLEAIKVKTANIHLIIRTSSDIYTKTIEDVSLAQLDKDEGYACDFHIDLKNHGVIIITNIKRIVRNLSRLTIHVKWEEIPFSRHGTCPNPLVEVQKLIDQLMTTADIETQLKSAFEIFQKLLEIASQSKAASPELDKIINQLCTFLATKCSDKFDRLIILGNDFSTNIQLFQDMVEHVHDGHDWRKVFVEGAFIAPKPPTDDTFIPNKKPSVKNKYTFKPIKNTYTAIGNYADINPISTTSVAPTSTTTQEYVNKLNNVFFSIYDKYPTTDEIMYFVPLMYSSNINDSNLEKLIIEKKNDNIFIP